MIKYKLLCNDCELKFDSWFSTSSEYEKLKKKKLLICHNCNSEKVEKTLMAPQLISKKAKNEEKFDTQRYKKIKKTIKNYQKFIFYHSIELVIKIYISICSTSIISINLNITFCKIHSKSSKAFRTSKQIYIDVYIFTFHILSY